MGTTSSWASEISSGNHTTPEETVSYINPIFSMIFLLPTSDIPASIFLAATQLISSVVTMTQQMKEYSENLGKHHDDDGIIDDDAEKMDWGTMMILMGFVIMKMLPARLMRPIWMR